MRHWHLSVIAVAACLLGACSTGPVRRISEPAASIQQLSVRADGRWDVQLRLQNYSSVAMRFAKAEIRISFDNGEAAVVQAQPGLSISPESADVVTATITPLPTGRARIATALADGRSLSYTLAGSLDAAPENGSTRNYEVKFNSALSPVPGLPGVLR